MPDQSKNFQIRRKPVGSSSSRRHQHSSQLNSATLTTSTLTTASSRPSPRPTWTHLHPDHILTPSQYAILREHDAIEHAQESTATRVSDLIGLPSFIQPVSYGANGSEQNHPCYHSLNEAIRRAEDAASRAEQYTSMSLVSRQDIEEAESRIGASVENSYAKASMMVEVALKSIEEATTKFKEAERRIRDMVRMAEEAATRAALAADRAEEVLGTLEGFLLEEERGRWRGMSG